MYKRISLALLCLLSNFAFAQQFTPLQVSNQNPLARIYAIPHAEHGKVLEDGQQSTHLSVDLASNFYTESTTTESIYLDGESTQGMIRYRYGFGTWEAGIDIPFIKHSEGSLDSFIADWHDWFGLSQGGRDLAPEDQLRYQYVLNGSQLLNITQAGSGIGDIRLTGGFQLPSTGNIDLALRGSIKFATGDSAYLRGSGGTDINIGLALSDNVSLQKYNSHYFVNAGVLFTDDGDVLQPLRENTAFYFSSGIAKDIGTRWQLKLQLDGHTQLYDSDLDALGESVQFSIGGAVELGKGLLLNFAVTEDVIVGSASDVSFHIGLSNRF